MSAMDQFKAWIAFFAPLAAEPKKSGDPQHPPKKDWTNLATNLSDVSDDLHRAALALETISDATAPLTEATKKATDDLLPASSTGYEVGADGSEQKLKGDETKRVKIQTGDLAEQSEELSVTARGLENRAKLVARRTKGDVAAPGGSSTDTASLA